MLYVCPTPIGNLADVTFRVVEVLKRVDIIAAEDTRRTVRLLDHYGIRAELLSFHDFNETRRVEHLVTTLREGRDVAVVSDAGMPGLSDPGFPLLRRCAAHRRSRGKPGSDRPGIPASETTATSLPSRRVVTRCSTLRVSLKSWKLRSSALIP